MKKKIALFGGSFNPPGIHHRKIVEGLIANFDEVIIVPCGPRPDKMTTNDIEPIHRAVMCDMTFVNLPKVRVELFDLENGTFTRTHELEKKFSSEGEIHHVIGTDLTSGGADKKSLIHRVWEHGENLWNNSNFVMVWRDDGTPIENTSYPPRSTLLNLGIFGQSSEIREKIFRHEPFGDYVVEEVKQYIERYNLYRGVYPTKTTLWKMDTPRPLKVWDENNPQAVKIASEIPIYDKGPTNCVVVIGGDGTMLRAIRKYWRLRVPFIGINTGHRGFLLNDLPISLEKTFKVHQLPLLFVETKGNDSEWKNALAFNDAWIERSTGQSSWIKVSVNGEIKIKKLVGDGILVSTAAGSTAYARAMGASPLLIDTPGLNLVGSNVSEPPQWKSAQLSVDSQIEFEILESFWRQTKGFVDGVDQEDLLSHMRIRLSRIAAAEIAFLPERDMSEKLSEIQFPKI